MANTTTVNRNTITISGLDADWTLAGDLAAFQDTGMYISSIRYHPSGADRFIVHEGGIDGASLFDVNCVDVNDDRIEYYDPSVARFPVIDISDCTLAVAANARLTFEFV